MHRIVSNTIRNVGERVAAILLADAIRNPATKYPATAFFVLFLIDDRLILSNISHQGLPR
jgi:hypothetical protein